MTAKPRKTKAAPPRNRKPRRKPAAPVEAPLEYAPAVPEEESPSPVSPESAEAEALAQEPLAFTPPEVAFAARVPPPEPERPRPTRRRAIFVDVENTSRPGQVAQVLELLSIDRADATTDLVASGNWRVIANETARLLARKGAHLVHSAPATGVRDWSDLRIAVAAGVWLASARPGDKLQIVSDDRAFDAVGDVAATLGVDFERLTRRAGAGRAAPAHPAHPPAERAPRGRGPRRRRRGEERAPAAAEATAPAEAPAVAAPAPAAIEEPLAESAAPQSAPVEDLLEVARQLLHEAPGGVSLDAVANRLKALGFERPPGSPRLVTRLRAIKELDVSPRGFVRLKGESAAAAAAPAAEPPAAEAPAPGAPRRRRRRGGRGRSGAAPKPGPA